VHKLLTIAAMLLLAGCAAPQEQVLKKVPTASAAPAVKPVNCTTIRERNLTTYTVCN